MGQPPGFQDEDKKLKRFPKGRVGADGFLKAAIWRDRLLLVDDLLTDCRPQDACGPSSHRREA